MRGRDATEEPSERNIYIYIYNACNIKFLYHTYTLFLQTELVRDWQGTSQIRSRYSTRTLDKAEG